jgi:Zn-dependent protease with chaperone function
MPKAKNFVANFDGEYSYNRTDEALLSDWLGMTRDEYESLVRRLEQEAKAHPISYRRKLGALALLGYAYIVAALVLLLCGGVLVGSLSAISAALLLIMKKAGWAIAALVFVAHRALHVRVHPPQGHLLTPAGCPNLFRLIEQVRAKLRAPRAHRVLLTGDFNAAIVQHQRFGFLAGTRNYLLLGLPLLQCLSPEELEAVIAHELGHLSGAHGRFGAWIYRSRMSWARLLNALQAHERWGTGLFTRFFSWYGRLFNAYSFVQARQQEYEADRMSVAVVGAEPTASALLRVSREGEFIGETFWPGIFRRADEEPVPSASPFTQLDSALRSGSMASREDWLSTALAQRTGYADTHPCLADRLKAIGSTPHEPPPVQASAAEVLLGTAIEPLRRELDEGWRARVRSWWAKRHQYASDARARLTALEHKAESLGEDELWERARLTEEFGSSDLAMDLYAQVIGRNDHHVGALWRRGQMLLARNDPRGIDQVAAAARIDPTLEPSACAAVVGYHRRHGREAEAKEYERRYWLLHTEGEPARRERLTVRARDRFQPHGLEPAATAELARRLKAMGGIQRALLVRKPLSAQSERSVAVLAIRSTAPWWQLTDSAAEKELIAQVGRECRIVVPELLVVSLRLSVGLGRPLRRVLGSEIFRRRG